MDLGGANAVLAGCVGVPAFTSRGSCGSPFTARRGLIIIGLIGPPSEGLFQTLLVEALLVVQAADSLVLEESGLAVIATM